jgi:hypothetical protein
MRVYVQGIGLLGPGLTDWKHGANVLLGLEAYSSESMPNPTPAILPPNECRRSSDLVRWSLHVAQEALNQAQIHPKDVLTIFASSEGESNIIQDICLSLTKEERLLSPTLFHHSGHNAAAGYWSIATRSQQSSTSLSCYDASFSGGLLEAAIQVLSTETPGLLVACDIPPGPPLFSARSFSGPFAIALLLNDHALTQTLAHIDIQIQTAFCSEPTRMIMPLLESLRVSNPAARALPLLASLTKEKKDRICLPYLNDQCLRIEVTPNILNLDQESEVARHSS